MLTQARTYFSCLNACHYKKVWPGSGSSASKLCESTSPSMSFEMSTFDLRGRQIILLFHNTRILPPKVKGLSRHFAPLPSRMLFPLLSRRRRHAMPHVAHHASEYILSLRDFRADFQISLRFEELVPSLVISSVLVGFHLPWGLFHKTGLRFRPN